MKDHIHSLWYINNQYIRDTELNIHDLFSIIDVSELIKDEFELIVYWTLIFIGKNKDNLSKNVVKNLPNYKYIMPSVIIGGFWHTAVCQSVCRMPYFALPGINMLHSGRSGMNSI